jgi:hypothetical protein
VIGRVLRKRSYLSLYLRLTSFLLLFYGKQFFFHVSLVASFVAFPILQLQVLILHMGLRDAFLWCSTV